jgi:hypothetical protein
VRVSCLLYVMLRPLFLVTKNCYEEFACNGDIEAVNCCLMLMYFIRIIIFISKCFSFRTYCLCGLMLYS